MSIFTDTVRKMIFIEKEDKELYIHSVRDPRAFIMKEGDKDFILRRNQEFHIFWAVFLLTISMMFSFLTLKGMGYLYLFVAFILFQIGIEIYYSVRVYKRIGDNKKYGKQIPVETIKKALRPKISRMMMFMGIILLVIVIEKVISDIVSWQNNVQNLIFISSSALVFFYIILYLERILKSRVRDEKE
ncbi:MAG: hypothetical protein ACOCWO_04985 [Candidatus Muiribacteriaceae bacterium]